MTVNELKTFRDTIDECICAKESLSGIEKQIGELKEKVVKAESDNTSLLARIAVLTNEKEEYRNNLLNTREERDAARRRLYETVRFLEEMWQDYSQIKWNTQKDKKRAKEMAKKIKGFAEGQHFHALQDDKGKWVAK